MKKIIILICLMLYASQSLADYKPIVIHPGYEHDKWITKPTDKIFHFAAFTTSFDGADDNDGDTDSDKWGVPEWVAFEIKKVDADHSSKRPSDWMTDETLFKEGIAPNDDTYAVKGTDSLPEVKDNYRFVRGHMCPKDTAERISSEAAYNTHTVLNAVPQLQWQNNGIWKKLEKLCTDWADKYERIWVVTGPVFFNREPAMWLGQDGENKAAIPDALFKIVIRGNEEDLETLAFLIPNILPKEKNNLENFLVEIDKIEALTGIDFLTLLDDQPEERIESKKADTIDW